MIGSMLDLTDRTEAEEELQRAKAEADHAREVAEAQKRAAEAANHAKDQFLAVLSHELRTPLTPVLSTVQALESEPSLPADLRDSIDMIRRNVELEARLIDDLLDLTRISKGKLELHLQTVDAHETLTTALDICRSDILDKGLQARGRPRRARTFHVRADSARLHQVFWNLIKNAVKFTPAGGTIYVTHAATRRDGGVGGGNGGNPPARAADRGGARHRHRHRAGGAAADLRRVRAGGAVDHAEVRRARAGAGDQQGADRHAGRAADRRQRRARAAARRSASTWHVVPAPAARPGAGGPRGRARRRKSDLRILLVDDHHDTALAMRRLLERLGYRITIANTLADAVTSYREQPVDLLISDIGLPDGSGLELIRQLKDLRPVTGIALSGFGMEEDVRKSKEAGFYEHLTKPVNFQRLHALIREATASGARETELRHVPV